MAPAVPCAGRAVPVVAAPAARVPPGATVLTGFGLGRSFSQAERAIARTMKSEMTKKGLTRFFMGMPPGKRGVKSNKSRM